jgi:hypothetical protein
MGLVLALRMLTWGALVGLAALTLFVEATRQPALLKYVTLPTLLAAYLAGTGQVLMLIRLSSWATRLMVFGPVLTLGLLFVPGLRSSAVLVCLAMGLGLWIYLGAFVRQAHALGHARSFDWFVRSRLALLALMALMAVLPNVAAQLTLFGGLIFVGATLAGWRLWLSELRLTIAEREQL